MVVVEDFLFNFSSGNLEKGFCLLARIFFQSGSNQLEKQFSANGSLVEDTYQIR